MTTPDPMQALREAVERVTDEDETLLAFAMGVQAYGFAPFARISRLITAARQAVQEHRP